MPFILVVLMSGIWPFGHHSQQISNRYLIPAWHVEIVRDRFDKQVTCRIFQGNRGRPAVSYERNSVAFGFPKSRNTLNAEFQVDGGPIRPWTSVYPTLVGNGETLSNRSMTNPTDGYVVLPIAVLSNASVVTIRSRPNDKPVTFSVSGLNDAFVSARRMGCDPVNGFLRSR